MKICIVCGGDDQKISFHKNENYYCAPCQRLRDKEYRLRNLEREKRVDKEWRQKNIDKVLLAKKKIVDNLGDSYIRSALRHQGFKAELPPQLIEMIRSHIILKRELKKIKENEKSRHTINQEFQTTY